jgi:phosphoribosylanthranilate isomerase
MSLVSSVSQLQTSRKVKICGVTQREQALAIAEMGADFIGLNFWPQSKRYLTPENRAWLTELPSSIEKIGVFVNPDSAEVLALVRSGLISRVQLHGDESPDFCADLQDKGLRLIKALQIRDEASLDQIADFPVQDLLLDAYHPTERGGLGETFPWDLALAFKRKYPNRTLWLAGGLSPDNIGEAVSGVRPYAVDVASGVEDTQPGVKNLDKVKKFIEEAKQAAPLI